MGRPAMMRQRGCVLLTGILVWMGTVAAQPRAVIGGVEFTFRGEVKRSVSLVGDFNGWSKDEIPLMRDSSGGWRVTRAIGPGIYQYKFVLDGSDT